MQNLAIKPTRGLSYYCAIPSYGRASRADGGIMSTSANAPSRGSAKDRAATPNFGAALIRASLVFPLASFFAVLGGYAAAAAFGIFPSGPPLGFALLRNGEVVAHIDALGRWPPDVARIRVSEVATSATVWDVKPTT